MLVLSIHPYIMLRYHGHICCATSRKITQIISLGSLLFAAFSISDTEQIEHHQIVMTVAVICTYSHMLSAYTAIKRH